MRRAIMLLAVSACSFEHGELQGDNFAGDGRAADNAPWLAGVLYRKSIALSPPALGAPLASFPLAIRTTLDAQLAGNARPDGRDIVFTLGDGTTRLSHELVSFDPATGALDAWVRVPELAGAATLYMYYGGSATTPTATVWPAPYEGVWHFDAGTSAIDSTPHGHGAVASSSANMPASVTGVSGRARSFDGVDDMLVVANPTDGSLDFGTSSFSFSLWVNVTTSNNVFDSPLYKGGTSTGDPGYCVLLGTGDWHVKVHDGTSYVDPHAGTETDGQWLYLAGVVDRSAKQMRAYRNGALTATESLGGLGAITNAKSLTFGSTNNMPFHGVLDEARIVASVLPTDWMAAEYANLTSPTFAVLGGQQMRP